MAKNRSKRRFLAILAILLCGGSAKVLACHRAGSREQAARRREQGARSREPGAKSRERRVGSREHGTMAATG